MWTPGYDTALSLPPFTCPHSPSPHTKTQASTHLGLCDGVYGPEELCALLYHVAARAPPDVGYPVGRQLLATPLPAAQTAGTLSEGG